MRAIERCLRKESIVEDEYNLRPMREEDWDRILEMEQEFFGDDTFRKDQFIHRVQRGNFFALEVFHGGVLIIVNF
jgi:hypothetical protein